MVRKLLTATLGVSLLLASSSAFADVVAQRRPLGNVTPPPVGHAAAEAFFLPAVQFINYATFNTDLPASVVIAGIIPVPGSGMIDDGVLWLFAGTPPLEDAELLSASIAPTAPIASTDLTFSDDGYIGTLSGIVLPPGEYYLEISGSSLFGPAAVSASVDTSAPVPEASTWTMMALGFAGVGFMGFRRRRAEIAA
jgi:PEP-CTERM motif